MSCTHNQVRPIGRGIFIARNMFKPSVRGAINWTTQAIFLAILVGSSSLPADLPPRPYEAALAPADGGIIQLMVEITERRVGTAWCGFALLDRAENALRVRLALIDEA